jgi:hypothetical protein
MLLSAAAQPGRSWAGPIALAVAYVIFRVGTWVWENKIKKPSPARALPGPNRVKVQATVGVTPDDTNDTERGEEGWWGRIREVGGIRFRQAQQIARTGNHELPPADAEPADDVDVPLDDEAEQTVERVETVEEYVARCRVIKVPYSRIVRVLVEHYGLTVDSAKYRIRKVDDARGGRAAA